MASKCAWFTDPKIGRWFYPQCMGGAVYGEHRCTCRTSRSSLADRVAKLERTVAEFTAGRSAIASNEGGRE